MLATGVVPAMAEEPAVESDLRIGVLAVADAIAAMGRTPELAEPLPFTRTSVADVLKLDDVVTDQLVTAMAGTDLEAALELVPGITNVVEDEDANTFTFSYSQTATVPLELAHDDGDLRFGANDGAGDLTVTLATSGDPFVVHVDEDQPDELLRFALISEPQLALTVDIDNDAVTAFTAREGFTQIDVTGGRYEIHRASTIVMRDPNGRDLLTLEDLRYSNLVDLYRITRDTDVDTVDIAFDIELPDDVTVAGADDEDAARTGTRTLAAAPVDADIVWPNTDDAVATYGEALAALTGLTLVDGMTALAEYTGTGLVLQNAADVNFPNLGGSVTDVFAPADELLEMLATSAVAEIRCGLTPENPPAGNAAPGDTVYCDAVTAQGLGEVTSATWTVGDGGTVAAADANKTAAAAASPTETVRIDGSDGQPDVTLDLVFADGTAMTARSLPRTIQDATSRIAALGAKADRTGASSATVNLTEDRLDVDVALGATTSSAVLPIGDPTTLGTLVGLTGLAPTPGTDPEGATATATATGATFDLGFGIPFRDAPVDEDALADPDVAAIELLPADASLFEVTSIDATTPGLTGLIGRIGFLGVDVAVNELTLGKADAGGPVVSLTASGGAAPIALNDLLTEAGTLAASQVTMASQLTASIGFTATEQPITAGVFATGGSTAQSGGASVVWGATGLPRATFDGGYTSLRVFDPVPAVFLSGTAAVTEGTETVDDFTNPDVPTTREVSLDTVTITVAGGDLFAKLGVPAEPGIEVARRLVAVGASCQNVTIVDATTLTCEGLAPDGEAAFAAGEAVELIVLGDPFALRDGIIDGLAGSLNEFERLDDDNLVLDPALPDDQYTSTLPLVDLLPAQLAVEREDIANGLADVVATATADETGAAPPTDPSVSSAQELAAAAPGMFGAGSSLQYTVDTTAQTLGVAVTAVAPGGTTLEAPLRFTDDTTGQVVSDDDVTVQVDESSTTVATLVDVTTARPRGSNGASSTSTASLDTAVTGVLRAGVAELTAAEGSTATLGVTVQTTYDATSGVLETAQRSGAGAEATIVVDERDDLVYTAEPWESSGGGGTPQPTPDPMKVKFLAEGLDGLAAALDGGLDGASPRVTGPDGAPVAAPLIGTDLDAGADVAGILTGLTSALRDELEADAVTGAETATDLTAAITTGATTALADAAGVSGSAPVVAVTCGDEACSPCADPEPPADGEEAVDPEPCATDGPTAWHTVSLSTTLTGETRNGQTEFAIGLDGINVRSDQPVSTTTTWTLPITLELVRGVGPQVTVGADDALTIDVQASIPTDPSDEAIAAISWAADACGDATQCIPAIIGYLPGVLTTTNTTHGSMDTTVSVALDEGSYDLFELYDGVPATTTFVGDAGDVAADEGLTLNFETFASEYGSFDLVGTINVPWTAAGGFEDVTYTGVKLDVGEVIATLATPFDVVDPYLGPARDVIDVLRTPIPVVSDISQLAGGDAISLLSLVESFGGSNPKLDLAIRITAFLETAVKVVGAVAAYAQETVPLEDLAASGALLTIPPSEVELASSCTQTVRTSTTTGGGGTATPPSTTKKKATAPCPEPGTQQGKRNQTTGENRRGNRTTKTSVATTTKSITGSAPGFSLPFLADPDQIVDVLTGEGEAAYFRLDFGTLAAQVAYTQKFGPIMAGPVPIVPFIGGSIGIEGRMAVGFDSMPQTIAVRSVPQGDIVALVGELDAFDGGDILREGFYLDDLDADGVDVPEVKLITTLEAGAGVSIGIVTAGLKGGITLTINLDLNDPNGDGRIRTIEIREVFGGSPECLFDVSATLEAFLQIFLEIELLVTRKSFVFDILRLGPYTLFEYGCPTEIPTLVVAESSTLALTSGSRETSRSATAFHDIPEDYEIRQFDTGGGAGVVGGKTTFEIDAINRVQRVTVTPKDGGGFKVIIFKSGVAVSVDEQASFSVDDLSGLRFVADGNDGKDDEFSFLLGETFDDQGNLLSTPFTAPVTLHGHGGDDTLVTGDAADTVTGGAGSDNISTGLGDDVITAGDGGDIVDAGPGLDDVDGGPGDDRLQGGPGPDRVLGGTGNDSLVGGPGRDVRALLIQGTGYPTPQEQVELGFDSGDILVGQAGADVVDGGDGGDIVIGGEGGTLATAGLGTLFALKSGGREVNVIDHGTREITEDVPVDIRTANVPGWAQIDTLCTSGPLDTTGGGGDIVTGGPEADVVIGGDGADDLDGGGGDDEICGRAGDDNISGDGGASRRDAGDDVVRGGHGNDLIEAGAGGDVLYGDDVDLFRGGDRVVDGTLGDTAEPGAGDDYIDGADGDDVIAGGAGSDLLRGGVGHDEVHGEGRETASVGGDAPPLEDRLVACNPTTRIVKGLVDLNGDLLAGSTDEGVQTDDGRLAGLQVTGGVVSALGADTAFTGLIAGETVVLDGKVDLDRNGTIDGGDTGTVPLASMLGTSDTNADGDCILGEDGDDDLRGGLGSDHVAAGDGTDLVDGGDGNDLLIGDAGTDVVLGGPHHDVLVGGDGDDHMVGGEGDDRLRGNGDDDDLVGGSTAGGTTDGQDVLLGGRGQDVLAGENAGVVSASIVGTVATAPWSGAEIVPAAATAGEDSELRHADSAVTCGTGAATRWVTLQPGGDEARVPAQSPGTPLAYDELYGGFGCDWVFGQEGDDLVRGGQDDDVVEGGAGKDIGHGDAGDDVVIGGSSVDQDEDGQITVGRSGAGVADGNDTLYGDGGPDGLVGDDLVIGDNGTPVFEGVGPVASVLSLFGVASPAPVRIVLADVPAPGQQPTDATVFGDDTVHGGGGDDVVFGQSGDDTLHGEDDDDHVEGNDGDDAIRGGAGDDDLIGGSSATNGEPMGDDGRRLVEGLGRYSQDGPGELVDSSAAGLVDGDDAIHGGDGEDVALGDNGRITRPGGLLVSDSSTQAVRHVAMADTTPGATSGSDTLSGDAGDDVLYGQLDNGDVVGDRGAGDDLDGGDGNDTLIGDVAVVVPTIASEVGEQETLTLRREIISELVYAVGTLVPVTHVPDGVALVGGSDVARGGGGDDVLKLGAGDDLANGGGDDDAVFGGAGDDALWGGPGLDRLFGGYGADDLDLKARTGDPAIYADVAGGEDTDNRVSTDNGADLIYGGWGPDELQADVGAAGPQPVSDHLVDWVGVHNVYYVCEGAYGAGRVIRQQSPAMTSLLAELVLASGGTQIDVDGSGGWFDFGLVRNGDNSANSRKSPEAPGNHTCEGDG